MESFEFSLFFLNILADYSINKVISKYLIDFKISENKTRFT